MKEERYSTSPRKYNFANILFSGKCNLLCPYCIGKQIDSTLNVSNLNEFPVKNLEKFMQILRAEEVDQLSITGTNTDPQLYRYEEYLLSYIRNELPKVKISLHTNGQLAIAKIHTFNMYDRAAISFPSFNPDIYKAMTGIGRVPDLEKILQLSTIPIKISCILDEANIHDLHTYLKRCYQLGIKRVALRQIFGDNRQWSLPEELVFIKEYCSNPVYSYFGMEVTHWIFDTSNARSLNLFSDGTISAEYLLTKK